MNYEFIEVGTCCFGTLIESHAGLGLSIEPLQCYLNQLPDRKDVQKVCGAIGESDGFQNIYHVDPDDPSIPMWMKGSSKIGEPHPLVPRHLQKASMITIYSWETLQIGCDIESVKFLKIDTEGMDHIVLEEFLKLGLPFPEKIRCEYHHQVSNITATDDIVKMLSPLYDVSVENTDIILELK